MTVQKTLIYLLKPGRRIQARTTRQRPGWLPSLRRDPIRVTAWQDAWPRLEASDSDSGISQRRRFVRAPRGLIQLAAPSGNLMFGAVAASPQQPTVTKARSAMPESATQFRSGRSFGPTFPSSDMHRNRWYIEDAHPELKTQPFGQNGAK